MITDSLKQLLIDNGIDIEEKKVKDRLLEILKESENKENEENN